ncbi:hypothetical protein C0J52_03466 [Blattella germanica]|nr:hypothetical protein C0J52_03466 [Blattella germanica]
MKGDQILAVNGHDLKSATQEEAAAVLKTAMGKVTMRLGRLKASSKRSSNADRAINLTNGVTPGPDSIPRSDDQNFPRFSTKRASMVMRHIANWSLRRRNL